MPYTIAWLVHEIVIEIAISGVVSAEDINNLCQDIVALNDQSPCDPLYLLVDINGITRLAVSFYEASQLEGVKTLIQHPKNGWIAYYDVRNPFYSYMLALWNLISKRRTFIFTDRDEAVHFLREKGAPLDPPT